MEILKFDDSEKSSTPKKPSSRGAILVGFIALVFGISTALAGGTLTINGDNPIILDQGVVTTNTCDDDGDVTVNLSTELNEGGSDFVLTKVIVNNLLGANCEGKYIEVRVYNDGSPLVKKADMSQAYDITNVTGTYEFDLLTLAGSVLSTSEVKHVTVETVEP